MENLKKKSFLLVFQQVSIKILKKKLCGNFLRKTVSDEMILQLKKF